MTVFNHSRISQDFNYYFGKQWHFISLSDTKMEPAKLEYRHLCSYSRFFDDVSIERTDLYEMEDGRKVLRLRLSVPTFDADDRVCDSWRCLYLFADGKWAGTNGIYAGGGYRLAFAATVHTLFSFPGELKKLTLTPADSPENIPLCQ